MRQLFLAGVVGIEPTSKVLETFILPMNYTPMDCSLGIYTIFSIHLSRKKMKKIKIDFLLRCFFGKIKMSMTERNL